MPYVCSTHERLHLCIQRIQCKLCVCLCLLMRVLARVCICASLHAVSKKLAWAALLVLLHTSGFQSHPFLCRPQQIRSCSCAHAPAPGIFSAGVYQLLQHKARARLPARHDRSANGRGDCARPAPPAYQLPHPRGGPGGRCALGCVCVCVCVCVRASVCARACRDMAGMVVVDAAWL